MAERLSLAMELFGIPERREIAILKEMNNEILKIYNFADLVVDREMIELALGKVCEASNSRKQRFSENYRVGKQIEFFIKPKRSQACCYVKTLLSESKKEH